MQYLPVLGIIHGYSYFYKVGYGYFLHVNRETATEYHSSHIKTPLYLDALVGAC